MSVMTQRQNQLANGDNKLLTFANRSGAATIKGGAYVQDLAHGDANTTAATAGAARRAKAMDNLVKPATATFGYPVVIAREVAADDADVNAVYSPDEFVETDVLVDGTDNIAIGDYLKLVTGQVYMVKATLATDRYHAIACEAYTTDATQTTIRAKFCSMGRI